MNNPSQTYTIATGNALKFGLAQLAAKHHGVTLIQSPLDIDEIQGNDGRTIVTHKLQSVYALTQSPVIVTDDYWAIPGLNGFPGAYMKDVSGWLTAQQWLDLCQNLTDRTIVLQQWVGYTDGETTIIVDEEFVGHVLTESRGSAKPAFQTVVTMEGDGGKSIAEVLDGKPARTEDNPKAIKVWRTLFAELTKLPTA